MTPREIVLANLEHKPSPRPGFNFSGGRMNDFLSAGIKSPSKYDKRWIEGNMEYYFDVWGNKWRRLVDGSVKGEIDTQVLESWDDMDKLEIPDFDNPVLYEDMTEIFSRPTDKLKVAHIGGWVFDNARYLRRLDNYLMDLILYPDKIMEINQMVADVYRIKIIRSAEAGAEAIMVGEDMGTQTGPLFGPEMYRSMFLPMYKELTDLAHGYDMKVMLHSCGQNWKLIDLMMEAGFDAFQFDQPAVYDNAALAEKFKANKKALYSPVDIQKVLPTGDRDFIEAEAKALVETFKGFLILKNYPDLHGIGVEPEWDGWAYDALLKASGVDNVD